MISKPNKTKLNRTGPEKTVRQKHGKMGIMEKPEDSTAGSSQAAGSLDESRALEDMLLMRIMRWEKPSQDEISLVFGEELVEAFDYVYECFKGQKRSDCDNPIIAHSFDVARKVKRYINGPGMREGINHAGYLMCALTHDVVEVTSSTVEDMEAGFQRIREMFGENTLRDIILMTDAYSTVINQVVGMINGEKDEKKAMLAALEDIHCGLGHELQLRYGQCFHKIKDTARRITPEEVDRLREDNPLFTFVECLKFKCYKNGYIKDIINDSKSRFQDGLCSYDITSLVKLADGIDAERTLPVAKTFTIARITRKAETKIDQFSGLAAYLAGQGSRNTVLEAMILQLKYELIDQLDRRRKGAKYLNSTRYDPLKIFFDKEISRLMDKYRSSGQARFDFDDG